MKRLLIYSALVLFFSAASFTSANAQLSANLSGGYGIPSQQGSQGIWGGGIGLKYFVTPSIAVGARVRTYVENIKQDDNALTGRLIAATVPIMATFDYQFILATLHPYVGLEAGVIRSAFNAKLDYNGKEVYNEVLSETNLGLAPKIGVGYDLTQGITLMAEALYNVGFGKNQAGTTQFNLQSTSRFLAIHAGVTLTFGSRL